MILQQKQTTKVTAGSQHIVWDYPMTSKDVGISYQEIDGESPDAGFWKNTVCKEWYFVISGSGTVFIDDTQEQFQAGDIVVLPVGKKHRIIGEKLKMIAITKPDWYEEQAEIVLGK